MDNKIDIDSYSQGIICRNNWIFIHYTHQENKVEDGEALFSFDTKGLRDVVFVVGYEDIDEYLFSQQQTPIFSRKCFTKVPNNEQIIQLRLPSLRISLSSKQVSNLIEVLAAFQETLENKLVVEQQKATLEKIVSEAGVEAEIKFVVRVDDSRESEKSEFEQIFEQIDDLVAHKSKLILSPNPEIISLKEKRLLETLGNQEQVCLNYLQDLFDVSSQAMSRHYETLVLLLGLFFLEIAIRTEHFGVIVFVYSFLILWFVVRNIILERLTLNAIENIYELIEIKA